MTRVIRYVYAVDGKPGWWHMRTVVMAPGFDHQERTGGMPWADLELALWNEPPGG